MNGITLPEGLGYIGEKAFCGCTNIDSINIPSTVITIENNAFSSTSIESVTIPETVETIGGGVFSSCKKLTSVDLPDNMDSIKSDMFKNCENLKSITIPAGIESIQTNAFYDCINLSSINIPDTVTSIYSGVFSGCESLESITIPEGVSSVSQHSFENCSALNSIDIPENVTNIGYSVFKGCDSLTDVYYAGTKAQWQAIKVGAENDPFKSATIHLALEEDIPDYETNILGYNNSDGSSIINLETSNNTAEELSCIVYSAVYNSDGIMKSCAKQDVTCNANDSIKFDITVLSDIENGDTIKIFMWDNVNSMKSLSEAKNMTIE